MKASRKGHVDIVRILIDAKAQVNTQEEVCCYYHTLYNEPVVGPQLHSWKVLYTRVVVIVIANMGITVLIFFILHMPTMLAMTRWVANNTIHSSSVHVHT